MARLTEAEIHAACDQLAASGEELKIESIFQYVGGRGGYGTISKYLKTWKEVHKDKQSEIIALSAKVDLPDKFLKDLEEFGRKSWHIAKSMCDEEIDIERQHLKQVEHEIKKSLDDSVAFGEKRAEELESLRADHKELKDQYQQLFAQHSELQAQAKSMEAKITALESDHGEAVTQLNQLAELVTVRETTIALLGQEKQQLLDDLKERDAAISDLKKEHAVAFEKLEAKHGVEIGRLEKAHDQTLNEVKTANARALDESEKSHSRIVEQLNASISSLAKDKQSLADDLKAEQSEVKALRKQIDDLKKSLPASKEGAKSGKKVVTDGQNQS